MASSVPSILEATTPASLVSLQTIAYIQALGIHSLSYTMPLKPLAAKAFIFNRNLVCLQQELLLFPRQAAAADEK